MSYAPGDIVFLITTFGLVGAVTGGFLYAVAHRLRHHGHQHA